ncbi:hypothetical protein DL96DRAFT_1713178 [Flagelloscypha sp. PMI_526]|nr:hypothetical protein DL96DRAFT_1713178 [Flagelloscypha sp. PMI_526]
MADLALKCIPPNPDISGVGVRTAIYVQNLLSFVPAIWAILDGKVDDFELESLDAQATTILITAFAILISAIVQVRTEGITIFHTMIILNLSWMNNTNTFIYFLLYGARRASWRTENVEDSDDDPRPTRVSTFHAGTSLRTPSIFGSTPATWNITTTRVPSSHCYGRVGDLVVE